MMLTYCSKLCFALLMKVCRASTWDCFSFSALSTWLLRLSTWASRFCSSVLRRAASYYSLEVACWLIVRLSVFSCMSASSLASNASLSRWSYGSLSSLRTVVSW